MPHRISSKTTTKTVRFADSPNDAYTYGPDHVRSQTVTYSSQRLVQRLSSSQHQHSYVYRQSQLLKDTYSPKYNSSSSPSSSTFCSPECSQYSTPLTTRTVPPSLPSSSSQPVSTQPHPTLNGLRHPIPLPPVEENFPETSTTFELYESLRPPCLSIDLSQDISPYVVTLTDNPDMSQDLPENMILVSRYLPWRIHISQSSVRDMVVALYTALRTRVTDEEMNAVGGKDVMKDFAKRVERMGEEERRKGVRRVDFLLGYTRFVGIEHSTDEPGVWKICLMPLS
ncbi:hypothetical protein ARMGADRAFT_81571 [Armillaria gallica]|uniref:DUF6699 domain-containing protein n=1 Tax=Armillaria gallica TaxID=47427 RepID=A0A2H3CB62_ARMGA|nr:hypothetical protein ARMGADRAFT_81571 [Armillaria gallica]